MVDQSLIDRKLAMPEHNKVMDSSPDTLFANYQTDPSQDNLRTVVRALDPTVNQVLGSINAADDPTVRAEARRIAAESVLSYSPDRGAALPTYVTSQLQQLRRFKRQTQSPVSIPDRLQLDSYHLDRKRKEFIDRHGRDPDMLELSDFSHIPLRRIKKINSATRSMVAEDTIDAVSGTALDFDGEAVDYVYSDSDYLDRKILEHRLGYGGGEQLSLDELAVRLKLSPSQISRKSKRLAWRIQELKTALEEVVL